MTEDSKNLASDISGWIVKVILDECMYTELELTDSVTRDAIAEGLKEASEYFANFNRTLH